MSTAKPTGPCEHGVVDEVCWHCSYLQLEKQQEAWTAQHLKTLDEIMGNSPRSYEDRERFLAAVVALAKRACP